MNGWWASALVAGAFAVFDTANAQVPHDLVVCLSTRGADCVDIGGREVFDLDCQRRYQNFYGRIAWYPLLCVGPITVEVETKQTADTRYPLYVEVVPLVGSLPCQSAIGRVVMVAHGTPGECGSWETSGLVDITRVMPVGSLYALRLHFFGHPAGFSPAVDCVRVTASSLTSGIEAGGWGMVKSLYR